MSNPIEPSSHANTKSCYRLYAGHGNWINLSYNTTQDLLEIFRKGQPCRYQLCSDLFIDIIPNDVDCNSKNIDMFGLMRADLVYSTADEEEGGANTTQKIMSHYIKSLLEEQGIIDAFPPPSRSQDLPIITSIPTHRHLSLVPAVVGATRRGPKPANHYNQSGATTKAVSSRSSTATATTNSSDGFAAIDLLGGGFNDDLLGGGVNNDLLSVNSNTTNAANLLFLSASASSSNSTSPPTSRRSTNSGKRTTARRSVPSNKRKNDAATESAVAKRQQLSTIPAHNNELVPPTAMSISSAVQLYDQHQYLSENSDNNGYNVNPSSAMLPIHFHHHQQHQQGEWLQHPSAYHHHHSQQNESPPRYNFEFGMDFDTQQHQQRRQSPTDILNEYDNTFHHSEDFTNSLLVSGGRNNNGDPTTANNDNYIPNSPSTTTGNNNNWRNNWEYHHQERKTTITEETGASSSIDSAVTGSNNTNEAAAIMEQQHFYKNENEVVVTTLPMERLLLATGTNSSNSILSHGNGDISSSP
jgi:hypothetical protein